MNPFSYFLESSMNKIISAGISIALIVGAGVATQASAQELTRAEVRQQLIQAENNGSRLVTETSYPDVSPVFAQQAARGQALSQSGTGTGTAGTSASGYRAAPACVGPASFCTPYFGS
jgi:hypothetical protein